MVKKIKFPSLYFGWWINICVTFILALVSGFNSQGASILFKPIAADLHLNRADASIASGVGTLQSTFVFPLAGWLSDKFGTRWLTVAGCCLSASAFVLLYFIQSAWAYYIVWGLMLAGSSSLGYSVAVDKLLTNWFVKKRGLAFSVRFVIVGLVGVVLLPVIGLLVKSWGWRATSLSWSVLPLVSIPVVMYFLRRQRPEDGGLLPDGAKMESASAADNAAESTAYAASVQEHEFTFKQALKTPAYWMFTIVWILFWIVQSGTNVHIVPMLTDMGIDPVAAASLMSMMVFFSLPSSFFGGIIADRVTKGRIKYLIAGALSFFTLGVGALLLVPHYSWCVYIFLILYGFGGGCFTPLGIIIISRYYGRKAYGSIQGSLTIFSAPIAFAAPIFTGWVYDSTGTYYSAFILFTVLAALAALVMYLMRVPRLRTQG